MKRTVLSLVLIAGLAALVPTAEAQETGSLFVIHGIPGLPDMVDVYANGNMVDSFDFTDSIGPLDLPEGDYYLEVKLLDIPVLSGWTSVEAGGNYTAIAHLTEQGGIQLSLFDNDAEALRPGRTRLTVRHTAQAPTVDFRLSRGENDVELLTVNGFSNPNQIGPTVFRWGSTYSAGLWVGDTEVFNTGQLTFDRGVAYIVYAIGSYPDSFQLFVQTIDTP